MAEIVHILRLWACRFRTNSGKNQPEMPILPQYRDRPIARRDIKIRLEPLAIVRVFCAELTRIERPDGRLTGTMGMTKFFAYLAAFAVAGLSLVFMEPRSAFACTSADFGAVVDQTARALRD
ncbi:MAG: hypothetical protein HC850_06350 [Rhodomicrobium sp.]|nr:hypothetical protein [Rhodomicrobium sp.]